MHTTVPVLVLVLALLALSALTTVGTIGQPRKPVTPGIAVWVLIVDALLALGVVYLAS